MLTGPSRSQPSASAPARGQYIYVYTRTHTYIGKEVHTHTYTHTRIYAYAPPTQEWEEFQVLAKHAGVCNTVVDFIPLHEVSDIVCDIVKRDEIEVDDSPTNPKVRFMKDAKRQSSFRKALQSLDLDTKDKTAVPAYDTRTHEVLLCTCWM